MDESPEPVGYGAITDADIATLQPALVHALANSPDTSLHPMAETVGAAKPWRDRGGTLYIDQWRLDPVKRKFISRPLGGREGRTFQADVRRTRDGWSIGPVDVGRQLAPRR
ncbi:MAG: hypothetical protein AB8B85_02290 [Paracoccaceae bacterium]